MIGTLMRITEKKVGIYLMQTLEMKMPILLAETVVRLSSKV